MIISIITTLKGQGVAKIYYSKKYVIIKAYHNYQLTALFQGLDLSNTNYLILAYFKK